MDENDETSDATDGHDWPVVESVTEYETGWYDGGYDLVEQPDGSQKRYYWAELPPAVVIVASTGEEVIFVEQYRPTIRETQMELPAGIVEDGESFTTAGARELREEGLDPVEPDLDDNEFLEVRSVPIEDALAVAREQPTNDATLNAILLAKEDGLL